MANYKQASLGIGTTPKLAFENALSELIPELPDDVSGISIYVHTYEPTPTTPHYTVSVQIIYQSEVK